MPDAMQLLAQRFTPYVPFTVIVRQTLDFASQLVDEPNSPAHWIGGARTRRGADRGHVARRDVPDRRELRSHRIEPALETRRVRRDAHTAWRWRGSWAQVMADYAP